MQNAISGGGSGDTDRRAGAGRRTRRCSSRIALEGLRCRLHGRSGARRGRRSGIGLSMGFRPSARLFRAEVPWRLFRAHRRYHRRCRRRLARKEGSNADGRCGERRA